MRHVAALEAKNRFGELLDNAQREPVTIEKHGRPVAVVMSAERFREYEALRLAQLRAEIAVGLQDVAGGRTVDGRSAFADVREDISKFRER